MPSLSGSVNAVALSGSPTTLTTGALTSLEGDTIVVGIGIPNATTSVVEVTDTSGNGYSKLTSEVSSGLGITGEVWVALGAENSTTNTITVKFSTGLNYVTIVAGSYAGVSAIYQTSSWLATTSSSFSLSANSPMSGQTLIGNLFTWPPVTTSSLPSGFTDIPGASSRTHQMYSFGATPGSNSLTGSISSSQSFLAVFLVLTSTPWSSVGFGGKPFVTVSPVGLTNVSTPPIYSGTFNNGADYGPDTPGTSTCGLEEAMNGGVSVPNYGNGGLCVLVLPGTYNIQTKISVPPNTTVIFVGLVIIQFQSGDYPASNSPIITFQASAFRTNINFLGEVQLVCNAKTTHALEIDGSTNPSIEVITACYVQRVYVDIGAGSPTIPTVGVYVNQAFRCVFDYIEVFNNTLASNQGSSGAVGVQLSGAADTKCEITRIGTLHCIGLMDVYLQLGPYAASNLIEYLAIETDTFNTSYTPTNLVYFLDGATSNEILTCWLENDGDYLGMNPTNITALLFEEGANYNRVRINEYASAYGTPNNLLSITDGGTQNLIELQGQDYGGPGSPWALAAGSNSYIPSPSEPLAILNYRYIWLAIPAGTYPSGLTTFGVYHPLATSGRLVKMVSLEGTAFGEVFTLQPYCAGGVIEFVLALPAGVTTTTSVIFCIELE
jgi:hypothetical protein